MNDITLDRISKAYGDKTVLRGLTAVIPAGRVTAVMAPSGAGKTTLLRLLLGLEEPDSGTVSGVPKSCAAVFQEDRLCPGLSAEKNIKMALGHGADTTEIRALLAELGIAAEDAAKPAELLSGGMRRRAAIARALLADAELLTLDEPFKGLDTENMRRTAAVILARTASMTVVLVTHSETEAELLNAQNILSLD